MTRTAAKAQTVAERREADRQRRRARRLRKGWAA